MKELDKRVLPMKHLISFDGLLKKYEEQIEGNDSFLAATAKRILDAQSDYPELRDGFTDFSLLEKYSDIIDKILQDTFTDALSTNEIKVATLPYRDVIIKT